MNKTQHLTWNEIVESALEETKFAYGKNTPEMEEFVSTFKEFYEEKIAETRITMWPVDPPSSHRMAKHKAETVYQEFYVYDDL